MANERCVVGFAIFGLLCSLIGTAVDMLDFGQFKIIYFGGKEKCDIICGWKALKIRSCKTTFFDYNGNTKYNSDSKVHDLGRNWMSWCIIGLIFGVIGCIGIAPQIKKHRGLVFVIGFLGSGISFLIAAISWTSNNNNCKNQTENDVTNWSMDTGASVYLVFIGGFVMIICSLVAFFHRGKVGGYTKM